jgi:hypothetical protein
MAFIGVATRYRRTLPVISEINENEWRLISSESDTIMIQNTKENLSRNKDNTAEVTFSHINIFVFQRQRIVRKSIAFQE